MRTARKTLDTETATLACPVCHADLLVKPVGTFLELSTFSTEYGPASAMLRRIARKVGSQQLLTWCGICWRFGLPREAVAL